MAFAEAGAPIFSSCLRRRYFSIVLDAGGRVLSTGFNETAPGQVHCGDGGCPRALLSQEELQSGSYYGLACTSLHSEINALMYSDRSLREGGTLVVSGFPCQDCAKVIAGSGVARLVYRFDPSYVGAEETVSYLQRVGLELIDVGN